VLRQALGYCWSVAIAADAATGLPLFTALTTSKDRDVQWIVRENSKKARLARLLEASDVRSPFFSPTSSTAIRQD
jgi:hypothetical protein